jgi:hypothetical protein
LAAAVLVREGVLQYTDLKLWVLCSSTCRQMVGC